MFLTALARSGSLLFALWALTSSPSRGQSAWPPDSTAEEAQIRLALAFEAAADTLTAAGDIDASIVLRGSALKLWNDLERPAEASEAWLDLAALYEESGSAALGRQALERAVSAGLSAVKAPGFWETARGVAEGLEQNIQGDVEARVISVPAEGVVVSYWRYVDMDPATFPPNPKPPVTELRSIPTVDGPTMEVTTNDTIRLAPAFYVFHGRTAAGQDLGYLARDCSRGCRVVFISND